MSEVFERRAHPRYAVSLTVRCRRLGPRQRQMTDDVRVVDVSVGGMQIEAPSWMDVGNVVEVSGEGIGVRGLVVAISTRGAAVAAESPSGDGVVRVGTAASGDRNAHIAFSSVAGAGVDLDRLLGRARAS